MSVDKIFETLSSAPRRRILAFLSKTDMTAGDIARRFVSIVPAGHLQTPVCTRERWPRMAREARSERALWTQGIRADRHAGAFPCRGVPALASLPQRQRRGRQAQKATQRLKAGHPFRAIIAETARRP
jgi:ArsR family transcriptional regulator, arsenate/arsenite/antimonite-responsive transcriptional repressor